MTLQKQYQGDGVTFIFTDKAVLIKTDLQCMTLRCIHKNWHPKLLRVRRLIRTGQITTTTEMLHELSQHRNRYGLGVRLIPTKLEWHI